MDAYWRLSSLYFWYFALLGIFVPYWALYLESRGFDDLQIAQLMATIMLTKIVAPSLWGWLADRRGQRLPFVRAGALLAALGFSGSLLEPGFWGMALVMLLYSFFWNAVLPLYEVITLNRLHHQRVLYGRIRLWGSIGFIVAVAVFGACLDAGWLAYLPVLMIPVFGLLILTSWQVEEAPARPVDALHPHATHGLWQVFAQRPVWSFMVANLLLQMSLGPYYTFFSIHLQRLGYSSTAIGLLWALGVVAEVILFMIMHRLFARYTLRMLALIALLATAARWWVTADHAQILWLLVLAQLVHAATYGVMHAVAVQLVHDRFPHVLQAQGQALYSGLSFGCGGALGAWGAGYLVHQGGTAQAFAVGAGVALMAAVLLGWGMRVRVERVHPDV
ncbi:MAG: MFS transporter [Gammaproteobacteria bacterium]|nr:MFS transporter [Gammaproteobacteria bacterium]